MKKISRFENQQKICIDIMEFAEEKNIGYMDSAIMYAEKHELEIEYIGTILTKHALVRSKIEIEAENLNFLKRKNRIE